MSNTRKLHPASFEVNSLRVPAPPVDRRNPRLVAEVVEHPLNQARRALTAAARKIKRAVQGAEKERDTKEAAWQQEAWAMYDQVGELHFAANVYANSISRIELKLARPEEGNEGHVIRLADIPDDQLTEVDRLAIQAMDDLAGDSPTGLADLMRRMGQQLFVPGEGLLIGLPPDDFDGDPDEVDAAFAAQGEDGVYAIQGEDGPPLPADERLSDLTWKVYSTGEVKDSNGTLKIAGRAYDHDEVLVIRFWRPHPRFCMDADSPVRSTLPVLRELVGLTMHVSAQIDSRLAGAGVLFIPQSATALGTSPPEDDSDADPVVEAIIEAAVTPIKDRDSAAAVVPVVITVPDDAGFVPQHLSFSTPLDTAAKELRDEAIRRLSLGWDMPPEQLLGLGESTHWNAWAIQEETVRLHSMPAASLIAEIFVREYLRPVLEGLGVDRLTAAQYFLDPEEDELVARPNRHEEALALFNAGALSREALLAASGYEPTDAPAEQEELDPAVVKALELVTAAPSLVQDPGLPALVSQLRAVLSGDDASTAPEDALPDGAPTDAPEAPSGPPTPPEAPSNPGPPPAPNGAPPQE